MKLVNVEQGTITVAVEHYEAPRLAQIFAVASGALKEQGPPVQLDADARDDLAALCDALSMAFEVAGLAEDAKD